MKQVKPLEFLARADKWYLGGGNRLLWAPPFPLFLDFPGLWDEAQYFNYSLQPLFTWTLLDEEGRELALHFCRRQWSPAVLTQKYLVSRTPGSHKRDDSLSVRERKMILPQDVAVCEVQLRNRSSRKRRLHVILWTVQENHPAQPGPRLSQVSQENGIISFLQSLAPANLPPLPVALSLGLNQPVQSFSLDPSERSALQPHWRFTPFYESFRAGRLPNRDFAGGDEREGLLYAALHVEMVLPAGGEASVTAGLAAAPDREQARDNLSETLGRGRVVKTSRTNWRRHFAGAPSFACSNEYFSRYYWYRWYGLRLNTIVVQEGNYRRPFVCEGIGYFRAPISYSAMCHMRENRWRHDPALAAGSLLTFIDNQQADGSFPGYIDVHQQRPHLFYHANWGQAVCELLRVHPSPDFAAASYAGLQRYARYFDETRDAEGSGLYDVCNQYETGQEFMSRYLAVARDADRDAWGRVFRLKGVDATVYLYQLKQALAELAVKLGRPEEARQWQSGAASIKQAILQKMWDPAEEMFFDVDPRSGNRTGVKAAVCFYPYFTDVVAAEHVSGLKRHLLNPQEFWTPFPAPAASVDDSNFCAEPEWKGRRMNCPWNGRVWPMTNSHLAEALAQTALRFGDAGLLQAAVGFISRFIVMMFHEGDPRRPNCFEHYHPYTGKAALYRGIDDYQHSWVNDLIIKYVCGIRPHDAGVRIDPLPFDLKWFKLDDVRVRGVRLTVQREGETFRVWCDGRRHGKSKIGGPVELAL
ncbi:MAG: trehalase family glycosidase [candidate division KSB1 bacterium]|nr:trehalase family glycosidase [candidate division KSB1 bacterium]MDZ7275718.1 trehalase family glycosidase [candidate division KSB1 bacterium]MDZ7284591.1 trehalase family glycosidase [candidate division KSB1 bacterium]MDZ7297990.1 trehalase family glycosidase [candidate division KSB1 bacterium]MDZ7305842.1 trehalase family glycosidase [candidate division KSB1 bacterium]